MKELKYFMLFSILNAPDYEVRIRTIAGTDFPKTFPDIDRRNEYLEGLFTNNSMESNLFNRQQCPEGKCRRFTCNAHDTSKPLGATDIPNLPHAPLLELNEVATDIDSQVEVSSGHGWLSCSKIPGIVFYTPELVGYSGQPLTVGETKDILCGLESCTIRLTRDGRQLIPSECEVACKITEQFFGNLMDPEVGGKITNAMEQMWRFKDATRLIFLHYGAEIPNRARDLISTRLNDAVLEKLRTLGIVY